MKIVSSKELLKNEAKALLELNEARGDLLAAMAQVSPQQRDH